MVLRGEAEKTRLRDQKLKIRNSKIPQKSKRLRNNAAFPVVFHYLLVMDLAGFLSLHNLVSQGPDCYLRQGAGGMEIARNGSRTWFLR